MRTTGPPFPAAFVDRDGTLIRDVGYIARAEEVEILPGAAAGVRRLNALGVPVIVVTNQSGIGRAWVSATAAARIQREVERRLALQGARLDGCYVCPHHPDAGCACRKPRGALFLQAARDRGFEAGAALYVGDRERDLAWGRSRGATVVRISAGPVQEPGPPGPLASDLAAAVELALSLRRSGEEVAW